jgi:hypothetical protein
VPPPKTKKPKVQVEGRLGLNPQHEKSGKIIKFSVSLSGQPEKQPIPIVSIDFLLCFSSPPHPGTTETFRLVENSNTITEHKTCYENFFLYLNINMT